MAKMRHLLALRSRPLKLWLLESDTVLWGHSGFDDQDADSNWDRFAAIPMALGRAVAGRWKKRELVRRKAQRPFGARQRLPVPSLRTFGRPTMKRLALTAALVALIALSVSGQAGAAGFDQFIAFGDSTLDTGYFRYHSAGNLPSDKQFDANMVNAVYLGATGGWAGNGVMNTTILAEKFGLTDAPSDHGGGNYANGGATTMNNNGAMVSNNVYTIQQIENYLQSVHGVANPNALYLIKTGDNDVTYFNQQTPAWRAANPNYLNEVADALSVEVARLQAAGARTIVVRNSYDSALMAQRGGDIDPIFAEAYQNAKALGTAEWSDLAARGVRFVPVDNDTLFSYVAHHPTLFGFTADTVLSKNAPFFPPGPQTHACFDIQTPEQQQQYLFIDGVHLTTAGQTIEADYTYSLLIAPSQIGLLAESVVQGGWARAATIQDQLYLEDQRCTCRPAGANFWTTAGAYNMRLTGAPGFASDSGTPYGTTVGVDYLVAGGLIVGAALNCATQRQEFSTGGHYDQIDIAPSIYVAERVGWLWGNAVATVDAFQDEVDRAVPLGIFIDQDHGHTTGQSLALALRGGADLSAGRFITGPVGGLVLQRVCVSGFTETGTSGVTALSFASQTRDSCVGQLGWRLSLPVGALEPFAEMDWNHEFSGTNRAVTASLTTVSAPSFSMDTIPVAVNWASLRMGASYQLNPRVMLLGEATALLANPEMVSWGGDAGLNISF
jgi:outer membrane lipase/esterase